MIWNWQKDDWPQFTYDQALIEELEAKFLHGSGVLFGTYQHISDEDKKILMIDLISDEALKTSEIEGEYLNRVSIQSSIRRKFGLDTDNREIPPAEQGIAEMMVDLYNNYEGPLNNDCLFSWYRMLTRGRNDLNDIGRYRTHADPMQVVSGKIYDPIVYFEAPPSKLVPQEMTAYIAWYNQSGPQGIKKLPALIRSGIAHLYFVSIHPFEDGNGRIGRAISEKALAQCIKHPTLIALSCTIQKNKKAYYDMLEQSNKKNEITGWLIYFANTILKAQAYTQKQISFFIEKARLFDRVRGQLNPRQEKVLIRMFKEGIEGFAGGLSADNYISITKTSRATATRDLQSLVEKNALVRKGELKATRYFLNIQI
ncbi:MAG: Fic family protein [Candidatus Margulisiibacteriota bacterium]